MHQDNTVGFPLSFKVPVMKTLIQLEKYLKKTKKVMNRFMLDGIVFFFSTICALLCNISRYNCHECFTYLLSVLRTWDLVINYKKTLIFHGLFILTDFGRKIQHLL